MSAESWVDSQASRCELRVLGPTEPQFRPALALVLTGRPALGNAAETHIQTLTHAVSQQHLRMELIVAAFEGAQLVTAGLAIESPGHTALIYTPSGVPGNRCPGVTTEVLTLLRSMAPARGIQLLQALLGSEDQARAEAHAAAGFRFLAELIYLERATLPAGGAEYAAPMANDLEFVTFSPRRRRLFREALAASYEASLDCPMLNGLRDLDDVLEGHMATGLFDPAGWTVALRDGEPAGVILTALLPTRAAVEVVYMGVSARARGQGVGNVLMAQALRCARRAGAPTLSLAVDSTNAPARRLYARWNLHETTRRRAWIAPVVSA